MDTDAGAPGTFTPDLTSTFTPAPAPTPVAAVPALIPAAISTADADIPADHVPPTVVAAEPQPPKEKKERVKKEKPEKPERREMKTVPEGMNTGVYTEEEERLFLEGLERFGRDWQRVCYKKFLQG